MKVQFDESLPRKTEGHLLSLCGWFDHIRGGAGRQLYGTVYEVRMWARTWLVCLVLTGVACRVSSARDDLVSYSLGALGWEGDFSDCLDFDQIRDGASKPLSLGLESEYAEP